jgi:CheY-like chemotaxis protein
MVRDSFSPYEARPAHDSRDADIAMLRIPDEEPPPAPPSPEPDAFLALHQAVHRPAPRQVHEEPQGPPADPGHSPALLRARALAPRLQGVRILWVDDRPDAVHREVAMLERLGMRVVQVERTEDALARLERERFDLVISDVARGGRPDEGVRALPALREKAMGAPVAFYVARLDAGRPLPDGALGMTDDPEELLELVMDGVAGEA